jgi:hypothetical protein
MMNQAAAFPPPPRGHLLPNPKLKLREQFHEAARYKHLSLRSEETYWDWVVRYLRFHRKSFTAETQRREEKNVLDGTSKTTGGTPVPPRWVWRRPGEMGGQEVREFLTDLAVRRRVGASTQNQALHPVR